MLPKLNKLLVIFFLPGLLLCTFFCSAQQSGESIVGYRPKIAEVSLESLVDYKTTAVSETGSTHTTEIENDKLLKIKLAVPLKLKGRTKMGLQLKYYQQRFQFDDDQFNQQDELFNYLSNQTFINTGARFIYKRNHSDTECISFIAGAELHNDEFRFNANSALYYLNGTYVKDLSASRKIGFGVFAGNSLGRFSILPLFIYENQFAKKWTLELVLPKSASLRYRLDNKTFISGNVSAKGWRYNLSNTIPDSERAFTLRRRDVQFTLSYEREIHDWLWLGVETGYNKNLQYVLTNPGERSRDALNTLTSKDATFLKFSIFIVPPKKLWNKM